LEGEELTAPSTGRLEACRVIHTVGPVWTGGSAGEAAVLAQAYESSLTVAAKEGLRTVAFPSISTGAFGYPVDQAAGIALRAVAGFVRANPGVLAEVRFVLFDEATLAAYRAALVADAVVHG
jgi:O-acetyl-ADP-ribose deacetylase (regulator of RNase III)